MKSIYRGRMNQQGKSEQIVIKKLSGTKAFSCKCVIGLLTGSSANWLPTNPNNALNGIIHHDDMSYQNELSWNNQENLTITKYNLKFINENLKWESPWILNINNKGENRNYFQ